MTLALGIGLVVLLWLWVTREAKTTLQEQAEIRKTTPPELQGAASFVGCLWMVGFAAAIVFALVVGAAAIAVWSGVSP